jgi:hypothetical protein
MTASRPIRAAGVTLAVLTSVIAALVTTASPRSNGSAVDDNSNVRTVSGLDWPMLGR